jgi:kynureninase
VSRFLTSRDSLADGCSLAGWWGNDAASRFEMAPTFRPTPGAKGYQHSCTPVLSSVPLLATLELIDKVGFDNMLSKASRLTGKLAELLKASPYYLDTPEPATPNPSGADAEKDNDSKVGFKIITPEAPFRGTQLSLLILPREKGVMSRVFERMLKMGVVGDEREPCVIRLSPVVLYNTFKEVGRCVEVLEKALKEEEEYSRGQ